MAMINQLNRRNGQPTPYFVIAPPGLIPHSTAHLTVNYGYLCSLHCRGIAFAPWLRSAAAVAPMKELNLAQQLAQDVSTLPASSFRKFEPFLTTLPASRVRCGTTPAAGAQREGAMEAPLQW